MKSYTFRISGSFVVQYTFTEVEVSQVNSGVGGGVIPDSSALHALEEEVRSALGDNYAVEFVKLSVDSDDLLGVVASRN